jgi:hypothetical protein
LIPLYYAGFNKKVLSPPSGDSADFTKNSLRSLWSSLRAKKPGICDTIDSRRPVFSLTAEAVFRLKMKELTMRVLTAFAFLVSSLSADRSPARLDAERAPEQEVLDQSQDIRDREQALRDQEQAVRDQEQAIRDQERSVRDQEQAVGDQERAMRDQEQSVRDHEQGVRDQEQAVRDQEQSLRDQEESLRDQTGARRNVVPKSPVRKVVRV